MPDYYINSTARITPYGLDVNGNPIPFVDLDGNPYDPPSVSVVTLAPNGTTDSSTPVDDGAGQYYLDLPLTQAGIWNYVWVAAGSGGSPAEFLATSIPGSVRVLPPVPSNNWTYSGNPASTPKDEIRFLTADTDPTKIWTNQDAEIQYNVDLYSPSPPQVGQNFLAAAVCAETILGKFKAIANSKTVGDLTISFQGQFQFYENLAYKLRQRANLQMVQPWVGGVRVGQKIGADADPDRVQPAVKVDGMNFASPVNQENDSTGN